jgi:glycerate 2-kinase
MDMTQRKQLVDIFSAALTAVDPYPAVTSALNIERECLQVAGVRYRLDAFSRVLVVGAWKAAARMAMAAEDSLGVRITQGLIIVKEGHTALLRTIRQVEAGHPVPDEAGVNGTREIITLLNAADEKTLVICLLSGGGSALMVAPVEGMTLADKRTITDLLLRSGADIGEINAVRKHLSAVKGGRLARIAYPATVITLILSDVIGDRLDVIASGPTAPDNSTFSDALRVIDKYGLRNRVPEKIMIYLESGASGEEPETPKEGDACFRKTANVIVGSLGTAAAAAGEKARLLGFETKVITTELQGEAREAAQRLAGIAREAGSGLKKGVRKCFLSGGETTVRVNGQGIGGRNQEFALAFAVEIAGTCGVALLSAGTDGTDGPTDAAGAIVDGDTSPAAKERGLDPAVYLNNNDSYTFFERLDALSGEQHHLKTGPTGTNVMDLQIMLVEAS